MVFQPSSAVTGVNIPSFWQDLVFWLASPFKWQRKQLIYPIVTLFISVLQLKCFFFFCQVWFEPLLDFIEVTTEEKTKRHCCSSKSLEAFGKCHLADCKCAMLVTAKWLALILKDGDSGEAGDISSNTSISPVCLFPSFPLFTFICYFVWRSQAEKQQTGNSPNEFVLFLQR